MEDVTAVPPGAEGEEVVAFKQFSVHVQYGSFPAFVVPPREHKVRPSAAAPAASPVQATPPRPLFGLSPITGGARLRDHSLCFTE
jgi:hypothetical protein